MKYILGLVFALLLGISENVMAQGDVKFVKVKEMRKLLRNDKQKDAENLIKKFFTDAKKDEVRDSAEYYYLNGMLSHYKCKKENTKLYLPNVKADTVAYFKALYDMYDQFSRSYPKIKNTEHAKQLKRIFEEYSDNLDRGGNFYLQKNDYMQSFRYYTMYIKVVEDSILAPRDSMDSRVFYNAIFCSYKQKNHALVNSLAEQSIRKGYLNEEIDLMNCEALSAMGKTDKWVAALKASIKRNPSQFFFYASLIDYYIKNDQSEKALKYADELVAAEPNNYLMTFIKGHVFEHLNRPEEALEWLQKSYEKKPDFTPTLTMLGSCYIQLAEKLSKSKVRLSAEERNQVKVYYTMARQYLETCRKQEPKKKELWAQSLYKVYYNLNEGEALEEIEKLIEK